MRKTLWLCAISLTLLALLVVPACKTTPDDSTSEPITIIKPDSLNLQYVSVGQIQPIHIQFTTDRPIDYAKCMYEVDTSHNASHFYTYPDTLFYTILDSDMTKLTNKYTYTGSYHVPDTLSTLSIIRFRVNVKASLNPSSPDTVRYQKEFKLVVR